MSTYRRDKLRRQIEAGKVTLVDSYHFDDMMGESRASREMPVALMPDDRSQRKEGICYIYPSDLDGHGRAYIKSSGVVHLYVHSNCSYDFRITG